MEPERHALDAEETLRLIGSDRIEHSPVFGRDGEKVGSIEKLMIDKLTGRVVYAVLVFGGFMGVDAKRRPVPWTALAYDPEADGYTISLTREQVKAAPAYEHAIEPDWNDPDYRKRLHSYYGPPG